MQQLKRKMGLLSVVVVVGTVLFLTVNVQWEAIDYVMGHRIPKVIAMLIAAFCIGSSAVIFQTLTHNPILTPSVLGLDALYVLVQTLIIFLFGSGSILIVNRQYNFLLAVGVMAFASIALYQVLFKKGKGDLLFLLLVGMIFGTLFQSLSSFMQRVIDPNEFLALQNSLFASFNHMNTEILVVAVLLILGMIPFVWDDLKLLDVLALGRDQAMSLGVEYERIVRKMMMVVTLLVSIATALVGPITFLGLLVVNVVRQLFKTYRHKQLILAAILLSSAILVIGQLVIEQVLGFKVTLSVMINLVGGIYFVYLLLKENKA